MILAVINQKGGAGKTTIALSIAAAMAAEGKRVLLVDTDPQATAQDWAAVRGEAPPMTVIGLAKPVLHRDLPALAESYDHVVIDGAPRNYEVARSAILAADLVLIPVQPSGADFWASRETVKLVGEATAFKETQKAAFVVSRKIGRTTLGREILEALEEFELPVLKAGTASRIAYAETMTAGTTVIESQPAGVAAQEVRAILAEIEEMMACPRTAAPRAAAPRAADPEPPVSSSLPPERAKPRRRHGSSSATELRKSKFRRRRPRG